MLEYLNTPEISRLALVIGAFTAVTYKDIYGINPGGIIVPGFIIILLLISPIWCISILLLSFIVYSIYKRFLERTDYKRRTPMYILSILSLAMANFTALIYIHLGWLDGSLDTLSGSLLPAVIALTFTKQKIVKVLVGIAVTTLVTAFLLLIIYILGAYLFNINFDTIRELYAGKETLKLKYPLIQFYIALLVGYFIYRYADVRSGGYLVAPVAAALLIQPLSAVFFLIGCFFVYLLTNIVGKFTLIVGLRRYALALFLSTIFVWFIELLFSYLDSTQLPFQGSNIFAIITMLSYVNDSILYRKKKVVLYIALSLAIFFPLIFILSQLNS